MPRRRPAALALATLLAASLLATTARAAEPWVVYEGGDGPGKGKHVVLVSGDEEYRSEEALPQLGAILAERLGFRCTVLFAIDPKTGVVNPNVLTNIPGLEALDDADLMVIFTRFRKLPDDQMQHIDDFLRAGKAVVGIRTSTHGFNAGKGSNWAHYGNGYGGDKKEWRDGFGRLVMGEKWISHHGKHRHESTSGIIAPEAKGHPIVRGLADGDVWGATDVYGVRLPLPGDSKPIVLGQVMKRKGEYDAKDPFYGLRPDDGPPVEGKKNDPMMPIAWTKTYQLPDGKPGRCFSSTIGASNDLPSEGTRRLLVQGAFWALGMEDAIPKDGLNVDVVGDFDPTAYTTHKGDYWSDRGLKPSDFQLEAAATK